MSRPPPSPAPGVTASRIRTAVGRWRRGLSALLLLAVSLAGPAPALRADERTDREAGLKAALVYNFTKFVEWPADAFATADGPIVVGVIGSELLTDQLAQIVRGRRVNGRPIRVERVAEPTGDAPPDLPHVLYVPAGAEATMLKLRATTEGGGVLTIGESADFDKAGGVIRFSRAEDKLRFEINLTAADRAHLRISAQLLKLAAAVRR